MTAWVVRAGRRGEYEETFISGGLAAISFGLRQSIFDFGSRESLRARLMQEGRTGRAASQLWNFAYEIQTGDMIVLPRKRVAGTIAVGRVSSDYE